MVCRWNEQNAMRDESSPMRLEVYKPGYEPGDCISVTAQGHALCRCTPGHLVTTQRNTPLGVRVALGISLHHPHALAPLTWSMLWRCRLACFTAVTLARAAAAGRAARRAGCQALRPRPPESAPPSATAARRPHRQRPRPRDPSTAVLGARALSAPTRPPLRPCAQPPQQPAAAERAALGPRHLRPARRLVAPLAACWAPWRCRKRARQCYRVRAEQAQA